MDFKTEEVLERKVVGIGTGAHINIPKKHLGKNARVTILRGDHNCEECGKPVYSEYEDLCEECLNDYENITLRKGKEKLKEVLDTALKNPALNEKDKDMYEKYLRLINKGLLYDHFYFFIYQKSKNKKKSKEQINEEILEIVRVGKLDEVNKEVEKK